MFLFHFLQQSQGQIHVSLESQYFLQHHVVTRGVLYFVLLSKLVEQGQGMAVLATFKSSLYLFQSVGREVVVKWYQRGLAGLDQENTTQFFIQIAAPTVTHGIVAVDPLSVRCRSAVDPQ